MARVGQVHAQIAGRAARQVLSGRSRVQGRPARRVRWHAKLGRGTGTGGLGPAPADAPVRQGLQRDHSETENRKYSFDEAIPHYIFKSQTAVGLVRIISIIRGTELKM